MKFRAKLTIAMVLLLSLTYGIGGSLMIAQSFSSSIDRERDAAVQTYRMIVDVLDLLGDNASPGTAANTVALVLHKLGSGGSSTAARIRFGAQMTTTGDTALLDEAPEPPAGSGVTSIVHTGNGRHYLMLGATADGTTVQLAFDVTETYTVRPCARATRWGSSPPTSTAWPGSLSATSTAFRRPWRCRSGSWPTSRTR